MAMSGSLDRKMISGDASSTTATGCCCSSVDPIEISVTPGTGQGGLAWLRFACARFAVSATCYLLSSLLHTKAKRVMHDAAFGGKSQINC